MSINFNYLLKYVIIGDSGVGKSIYYLNTQMEHFLMNSRQQSELNSVQKI